MRLKDAGAAACAGGAAIVAVLGVGGALRGVQAIVAVLVALALAWRVTSQRGPSRISPLIAFLLVAIALCAVQLVPLPSGVLEKLAPVAQGLREDGAALLGADPASTSSFDVPGTLRALAFFTILLGVAAVALRMATSEKGRYQLLAAVAALYGVAALVVGVHYVLGARSLYGLYELRHVNPHLIGPLLNLNHLGCAMAVGAVLSVGLAAYPRQRAWLRVAWLAGAGACGAVAVATVSRGATLALGAGGLVTLGLLAAHRFARPPGTDLPRRRRGHFATSSLPIGIVATCAVVLVVYSSATNVGHQLAQTSFDEMTRSDTKFGAWRSTLQLVEEMPWLGVGRGAFEATLTRVHPGSGAVTFSHVENEYLQAIVDWGIPGTTLLGIAGLWFAIVAIRKWRDGPLAAAALGAIVVVAVQSNVDFGIELLGLAVPLTAVAATLAYVPLREVHGRPAIALRAARGVHVVALLLAALLLRSAATTTLDEDHEALRDHEPTLAELRAAAERHPLDYFVYARAAEVTIRRNDKLGVQLLNHAMRLHPTHPGLHRIAARMLYHRGYIEQAALEYSAALRVSRSRDRLLQEIVTLLPRDVAALAIPADDRNIDQLVAALGRLGRPDVATAWLGRVLEVGTNNAHACDLVYASVIAHEDPRAAELAARRCSQVMPGRAERLALAEVLVRQHSYSDALRLLEDVESWPGRVDNKARAWLLRCDALGALGDTTALKRCLRRLDASGIVDDAQHAAITDRLDKMAEEQRAKDLALPK